METSIIPFFGRAVTRCPRLAPGMLMLVLVLNVSMPIVAADEPTDPLLALADRFARAVLEGDNETVMALATERMQAAMSGVAGERLRSGLDRQFGALRGWDPAWLEDGEDEYHRLRVPARFERGEIDLRVVVDQAGKVAGFFMAAHEPPPGSADGDDATASRGGQTPGTPGVEKADDTPAPEGVKEIDLVVGDAETGLPARLSLPAGSGPFPGVVLIHGSGPHGMDGAVGPNKTLRELAWGLALRGVAVLRYDKRSYARPADLIKHGPTLTADQVITDDARIAVSVLRAQGLVDAGRVYIIGHSLGGTMVPRIAAGLDRPLAGIVALAGLVRPLPETMLDQTRYVAALDGEVSEQESATIDQIEHAVTTLRSMLDDPGAAIPTVPILGVSFAFWKDLDRYHPPTVAARLGIPILIAQGGRDYQVTMEDFGLWKAGLEANSRACFVLFDHLDHLFRPGTGPSKPADYQQAIPIAPAVLDTLRGWIVTGTCPPENAAGR